MAKIQCFMLERSEWVRDTIRRYSATRRPDGTDNPRQCPLMLGLYSYHNASVEIGTRSEAEEICYGLRVPKNDPQWPLQCGCGYVFQQWDEWQFVAHRLYRRIGTDDLLPLHKATPGAMWYADWMTSSNPGRPGTLWHGPDGRCLVVQTPGGEWVIDGPSQHVRNKPAWLRTGAPPDVTATPSIICGKYHGWLTEGWLIEC